MTLNEYILILGSNIDRENNILRACRLIENMAVIKKRSAVFETPSIKKGLPAFLDQAIIVETALDLSTIKTELWQSKRNWEEFVRVMHLHRAQLTSIS